MVRTCAGLAQPMEGKPACSKHNKTRYEQSEVKSGRVVSLLTLFLSTMVLQCGHRFISLKYETPIVFAQPAVSTGLHYSPVYCSDPGTGQHGGH